MCCLYPEMESCHMVPLNYLCIHFSLSTPCVASFKLSLFVIDFTDFLTKNMWWLPPLIHSAEPDQVLSRLPCLQNTYPPAYAKQTDKALWHLTGPNQFLSWFPVSKPLEPRERDNVLLFCPGPHQTPPHPRLEFQQNQISQKMTMTSHGK